MITIYEEGVNKTNKTLQALATQLVNISVQSTESGIYVEYNDSVYPSGSTETIALAATSDPSTKDTFAEIDPYVDTDYVDFGYEGEVKSIGFCERVGFDFASSYARGAKPVFVRLSQE